MVRECEDVGAALYQKSRQRSSVAVMRGGVAQAGNSSVQYAASPRMLAAAEGYTMANASVSRR